jgi:hypothetical protein
VEWLQVTVCRPIVSLAGLCTECVGPIFGKDASVGCCRPEISAGNIAAQVLRGRVELALPADDVSLVRASALSLFGVAAVRAVRGCLQLSSRIGRKWRYSRTGPGVKPAVVRSVGQAMASGDRRRANRHQATWPGACPFGGRLD